MKDVQDWSEKGTKRLPYFAKPSDKPIEGTGDIVLRTSVLEPDTGEEADKDMSNSGDQDERPCLAKNYETGEH